MGDYARRRVSSFLLLRPVTPTGSWDLVHAGRCAMLRTFVDRAKVMVAIRRKLTETLLGLHPSGHTRVQGAMAWVAENQDDPRVERAVMAALD